LNCIAFHCTEKYDIDLLTFFLARILSETELQERSATAEKDEELVNIKKLETKTKTKTNTKALFKTPAKGAILIFLILAYHMHNTHTITHHTITHVFSPCEEENKLYFTIF
jgi:hypothetical protein